ncbi:MAG: hypothetical protein K2H78_03835 [Clostridia bacterium]|nr:hypothetical protein [Clostridia bacterium]
MNRKTALAVICGVLAAGVLCAVVGIIVYFTASNNALSLLIGLFTIFTGAIIAGIAAVVLVVLLIIMLISRNKNNKNLRKNGDNYDR